MRWRATGPLLATMVLVASLAACGDDGGTEQGNDVVPQGGQTSDGGAEVEIVDFTFTPETVTVEAGTTVVWTNVDDATHSIRDSSDAFESDDLAQGDTFEQVLDEPGG